MSGSTTGFLFGGSPVPPQPTGSDSSTQYPLWLQQFVSNLASSATNLASQPYSQYPGPQVAAPSAPTQQAWNMALNNVGSYQPALQQAYSQTGAGGQPIGFSQLTGADIQNYMNPYQGQVIGGLESAANTNLFQNILPSVQDRFTGAGQSRSPQEMQATNNAIYQSNQALDQAIGNSLQTGYQGALQTAQQQQGMGYQVAQGNRAAAQAAGAQYGQLGALQQQLGAADIGQVAAAGQGQDINNQANLNAGLNNFYAQQQWPYQNLAFASNIIRGQPVASNQQTVGLQYNPGQTYTPSPLSSFIGTTLGASALSNNSNSLGLRKGGRVGYATGGALRRSLEEPQEDWTDRTMRAWERYAPNREGAGDFPNHALSGMNSHQLLEGADPREVINPDNAASLGRGNDTELAHVSPREGALLRSMGGSGTINPRTGLREYDDSGGGGGGNLQGAIPGQGPAKSHAGGFMSDDGTWQPPTMQVDPALYNSYGASAYDAPAGAVPLSAATLAALPNFTKGWFGEMSGPLAKGDLSFMATPGNPYYSIDPSTNTANLTPEGARAWQGAYNSSLRDYAANAKKNASGLSGYLSTPAGGLSMLALPLAVGLAAPALAGALGAGTATGGAAAGAAGEAADAGGASLAATSPEAGGGALSSWFTPANAVRAVETVGKLASGLTSGAGGSPASVISPAAATAGQVASAAAPASAFIPNNPAFYAALPSHSFYAARGGAVPGKGALTRRLQRVA